MRNPSAPAAQALRDKGVSVRLFDYSRPDTLSVLEEADRLLLISGSELGQRTVQHANVIAAAQDAGIELIAYTSLLHADRSPLLLAREHVETEAALKASGLPWVLLRNGWYTEVFTWRLPVARRVGIFYGASGQGRISSAARADYARAAAAVLADDGHAGRTYELAGDRAWSLAEFVEAVATASGEPLAYRNLEPAALRAALTAAGVPDLPAQIVADVDAGVAEGALFDESGDLSRLTGRPTTAMETTVQDWLRTLRS